MTAAIKIAVLLQGTSQSRKYDAINTYQKGDMFCVLFEHEGKKIVHKYPISTIFRVEEEY